MINLRAGVGGGDWGAPWDPLSYGPTGPSSPGGGDGGSGSASPGGGRREYRGAVWRRLLTFSLRIGGSGGGETAGEGRGGGGAASGSWDEISVADLSFAILRESVARSYGGYVHPDLGALVPAPCGAARGLGLVRHSYSECRGRCSPPAEGGRGGNSTVGGGGTSTSTSSSSRYYPPSTKHDEILIRVPIDIQMTRYSALATLVPLIPAELRRRAPLEELDDAALLVLQLAHERGRGKDSPHSAYVLSLPPDPPCGYSNEHRADAMDAVTSLGLEMGIDVNGWPAEIVKASDYANRIADALSRDYGPFLASVPGISFYDSLQWALCQVASRAMAGSDRHGPLRLIPLLDMVNHDASAGNFVELNGEERVEDGNFLDATEDDSGTFVLRSLRHGRKKPLKMGQELLANYNVPGYSPLDWFLNLGFIPRERLGRWMKVDGVLPRTRTARQPPSGTSNGGDFNAQGAGAQQQHPGGGGGGAGVVGGIQVEYPDGFNLIYQQGQQKPMSRPEL